MDFSYDTYQATQNRSANQSDRVKHDYFKLASGDEALIRFNISCTDDIKFVSVHKPIFGKKFEGLLNPFAAINCLNPVDSYEDKCPFCRAAQAGHQVIAKAAKVVYIPMLVAYKDKATGNWLPAVDVIWERPAGFAKELATLIKDYGDLRENMLKCTRTGEGKETRYLFSLCLPNKYNPELVPTDFSKFDGYQAEQSYWKESAADMTDFIMNGKFNNATSFKRPETAPTPTDADAPAERTHVDAVIKDRPAEPQNNTFGAPFVPEDNQAPAAPQTPAVETPVETPAQPTRNFSGFTF